MEIQTFFFSIKCHQLLSKKLEALNYAGLFSEELATQKINPKELSVFTNKWSW